MPFVPALDGLRGLAVATVVIYHLFPGSLVGGYLGVDMFFVLSGFLITSLMLRERILTGAINLKGFWLRRLRRIAPAAILVLLVGAALAGLVRGDSTVGLGRQVLTGIFFVNNWGQIAASQSYFASPEFFAHFWSLSVEEQFYVFWPLVVVAFFAVAGLKRFSYMPAVIVALALASATWMFVLYTPGEDPTRVYYGTDTHAFSLLVGAALASWLVRASKSADAWGSGGTGDSALKRRRVGAVLEIAGLVGFLALVCVMRDDAPVTYRGGLLIAALCVAAMVHGAIRCNAVIQRVFTLSPLRHLGKISYSLYLWHWSVYIVCSALIVSPFLAGVVALLVSLGLSELSYRFVEQPFRRRGYVAMFSALRESVRRGAWRGITAVAGAAVLVFGAGTAIASAPRMTALEADLLRAQQEQQARREQQRAAALEAEAEQKRLEDELTGPNITAIGDSVMLASAEAIEEQFPGVYLDAAVSRHYESVPGLLEELDAAGLLQKYVVLGFGTNGPTDGGGDPELMDEIINRVGPDRTLVFVLPFGDRWYMPDAQQELLDAARGHDNVYVADWCTRAQEDPSMLRGDQIHPDPPGAVVYAEEIRQALEQSVRGEKEVPDTCGV